MTIKLHLEHAESDPVIRTAEAFGCRVEDVVYVALNEYMLRLGNFEGQCGPECRLKHTNRDAMRAEVENTIKARKENLPLWADSAGVPHNYEGDSPDQPAHSKNSLF